MSKKLKEVMAHDVSPVAMFFFYTKPTNKVMKHTSNDSLLWLYPDLYKENRKRLHCHVLLAVSKVYTVQGLFRCVMRVDPYFCVRY